MKSYLSAAVAAIFVCTPALAQNGLNNNAGFGNGQNSGQNGGQNGGQCSGRHHHRHHHHRGMQNGNGGQLNQQGNVTGNR